MKLYDDPRWLNEKYVVEGLSITMIGQSVGRNYTAIRKRLMKYHIPIRTKLLAQRTRAWRNRKEYHSRDWLYQKYWTENLNTTDIAKMVGRSREHIYSLLLRYNIKIKTSSESRTGRSPSPLTRLNMRKAQLGRKHPEAVKRKIGDAQRGEKNHLWGKKLSKDHIEKLRRASQVNWQNPRFVRAALHAMKRRPTHPELVLAERFPELQYTGNGKWWRTLPNGKHKNPDFKVSGQDKVIEVYGDYWHRNDNPQLLIDNYKQSGLDCLVLWEHEIYKQPELVSARLTEFLAN